MRFCCMTYPTDALDMREKYLLPNIIEKLSYYLTVQQDNQTKNEDIVHNPISEIQYLYDRIPLYDVNVSLKPNLNIVKQFAA